ncbi:hypothetical protein [Xanthocytophaga agilis]|uniref:Uncharacterized protein n=1 Tax=Xanthocytophaga agilis TaxID=3048010 RepID=A0AAE3R8Q6_9BACT|nr:hypothetical protein [Xanthocytophaga agilis]MDJ1505799.1 hypothetical protein [Xanthocytophaga agilis]
MYQLSVRMQAQSISILHEITPFLSFNIKPHRAYQDFLLWMFTMDVLSNETTCVGIQLSKP